MSLPMAAAHSNAAWCDTAYPRLPVVGYERGDDLGAMQALGFRSLGALRVWITAP